MIFVMASNSHVYAEKNVLLGLGIAYLYIGLLDFMHVISYRDINILTFTVPYMSKSFWMAARLLEATNIFFIFYLYRKSFRLNVQWSHIGHLIYTLAAFVAIYSCVFPENMESSLFAIDVIVELFIVIFLIGGLYFSTRLNLTKNQKTVLHYSIIFKVLSEIIFVIFIKDYFFAAEVGVIFKVLSYFGFYYVFVTETIKNPYKNLQRVFEKREMELTELSKMDLLTGLYNHNSALEKITNLLEKYSDSDKKLFVTMIDIDNFKGVNDTYGHQVGDMVLEIFSRLLQESEYEEKIVGRYGGDEFIISGIYDEGRDILQRHTIVTQKLEEACSEIGVEVTFSAGVALSVNGDSVKDLIYKADIKLYESKKEGKNRCKIWKSD